MGFRRRRRRIAKSFGRHRCVHNIWLVYAGVTENDAADEPTRACSSRLGSGKFDATRNETCGRTSKGKGRSEEEFTAGAEKLWCSLIYVHTCTTIRSSSR